MCVCEVLRGQVPGRQEMAELDPACLHLCWHGFVWLYSISRAPHKGLALTCIDATTLLAGCGSRRDDDLSLPFWTTWHDASSVACEVHNNISICIYTYMCCAGITLAESGPWLDMKLLQCRSDILEWSELFKHVSKRVPPSASLSSVPQCLKPDVHASLPCTRRATHLG